MEVTVRTVPSTPLCRASLRAGRSPRGMILMVPTRAPRPTKAGPGRSSLRATGRTGRS
jgi:hypothetical protein